MGQLEDARTVLTGDAPRSIVLKLCRSCQARWMIFGLFCLTIAADGLLVPSRSGQSYNWFLLLPLTLAIYALPACVPGAFYLRLDPDGMMVRQSFYRKRLRWAAINGIREDHLAAGRGGKRWGIMISVTGENGVRGGYFVSDIYTLDRTELVRVMRDMWISAGAGNGHLPVQ